MKRNNLKMGLIERSALTFQSYLNSEFGDRFYTDEFLNGICKTRSLVHLELGKSALWLIASSLVLTYFELLPPKINVLQNEITLSKSLIPIINVIVSLCFFNVTIKFFDSMIIDRYISKIGESINIYSFNLFLLDKNPVNIWIDPLISRVFGAKSGFFHKSILPFIGVCFSLVYLGFVFLFGTLIFTTAMNSFFEANSNLSSQMMSALSLLLLFLTIVVIIAYLARYRFYEADFEESTLEPTKYFKENLEKEMRAQTIETPANTPASPPAHDGPTPAAP